MSDPSDPAGQNLREKVMAFITGPAGQSLIRRALSGSGVAGVWLIHKGFPAADLGSLADGIILIAPFIVAEVWSQFTKTKAAIVTQAAKIVADRQGQPSTIAGEMATGALVKAVSTMPGVQVAVDTKAASPPVAAVALDPAVANVQAI